MDISIPLNLDTLTTLGAAILLAVLIGLWSKLAITKWRWRPFLVLGLTVLVMLALLFAFSDDWPTVEAIARIALLAFVGATIETFGYESVINGLGAAGIGPRSDKEQEAKALTMLRSSGYEVIEPPFEKAA